MWVKDIRMQVKDKTSENQIVNIVILDDDAKKSMMTNQRNSLKDNNIVYIEIKGFSNYSDLFDVVTCDMMNRYSSIDDITKQFNIVLKLFVNSKINLFASREATIIVPFFINYYNNKINKIVVINPIYYPYSFHVFYRSVHDKKLDVHLKPNLIRIFNGLSLMKLYFDKNTTDKKFNRLYSRTINVDFDTNCDLYTNQENLAILLDLYSHVRVEESTKISSNTDDHGHDNHGHDNHGHDNHGHNDHTSIIPLAVETIDSSCQESICVQSNGNPTLNSYP
jgi:hypothetical protein